MDSRGSQIADRAQSGCVYSNDGICYSDVAKEWRSAAGVVAGEIQRKFARKRRGEEARSWWPRAPHRTESVIILIKHGEAGRGVMKDA